MVNNPSELIKDVLIVVLGWTAIILFGYLLIGDFRGVGESVIYGFVGFLIAYLAGSIYYFLFKNKLYTDKIVSIITNDRDPDGIRIVLYTASDETAEKYDMFLPRPYVPLRKKIELDIKKKKGSVEKKMKKLESQAEALLKKAWKNFPSYKKKYPEHAGVMIDAMMYMFYHEPFPAAPDWKGHAGKSLTVHTLNVLKTGMFLIEKYMFFGLNRKNRLVMGLREVANSKRGYMKLNNDPVAPIALVAHDIGKLVAWKHDPETKKTKEELPFHDMPGARLIMLSEHYYKIPWRDRNALNFALYYYHHIFGGMVEMGDKFGKKFMQGVSRSEWIPDRYYGMTDFVKYADKQAGFLEEGGKIQPFFIPEDFKDKIRVRTKGDKEEKENEEEKTEISKKENEKTNEVQSNLHHKEKQKKAEIDQGNKKCVNQSQNDADPKRAIETSTEQTEKRAESTNEIEKDGNHFEIESVNEPVEQKDSDVSPSEDTSVSSGKKEEGDDALMIDDDEELDFSDKDRESHNIKMLKGYLMATALNAKKNSKASEYNAFYHKNYIMVKEERFRDWLYKYHYGDFENPEILRKDGCQNEFIKSLIFELKEMSVLVENPYGATCPEDVLPIFDIELEKRNKDRITSSGFFFIKPSFYPKAKDLKRHIYSPVLAKCNCERKSEEQRVLSEKEHIIELSKGLIKWADSVANFELISNGIYPDKTEEKRNKKYLYVQKSFIPEIYVDLIGKAEFIEEIDGDTVKIRYK